MRKGLWYRFLGITALGGVMMPLTACPGPAAVGAPARGEVQATQTARPLPPGGVPALPNDTLSTFTIGGATSNAKMERVAVSGQPFAEAVRLTTTMRTPEVYGVQFSARPTIAVKRGETMLMTFYARTVKGQAETGEARTQFVFERNGEPYTKSVSFDAAIPAREWKRFDVPFKAAEDLKPAQASVHFRLGYDPQSFELGGISLTKWGAEVALSDLPRTSGAYAGIEATAAWRQEAQNRIEKIRKGDMTVRVMDASGKPISGATVAIRMKRHAFGFGSAVAADMLLQEGPDADKYRDFVVKHMNRVVLENDLKWAQWEENPERAKRGVAWLREHGIEVRGHNLVWPGARWLPRDVLGLRNDKAALAKRVKDHIVSETAAFKGQLAEWDVVNEPYANHDIQDILGEGVLVEWFKLAHEQDPNAILYLNDYPPLDGGDPNNAHLNHFEKTLRFLKDKGAPLGGIGFQGHFGGTMFPPTRILSGLDRFAKLGLPVAITEFDMNTTDRDLQVAYTRDFLTACFSHPSVNQVIMWGFWEGRHWLPDAALIDRNWTIRPHGQAWIDLVTREWWTNADGASDREGVYRMRGFLGDYEITATVNGKSTTVPMKLTSKGASVTVNMD